MDYDEAGNFSNATYDDVVTADDTHRLLFHELVFAFVCILGIVANGFTIYIFTFCKKVKSASDEYLLNSVVADGLLLLATPFMVRLIFLFDRLDLPLQIICIFFQSSLFFQFLSVTFSVLALCDWLANLTINHVATYHKNLILVLWVVTSMYMMFCNGLCFSRRHFPHGFEITIISFGILLILTVVTNSVRFWKGIVLRDCITLIIVTSYALCWGPVWLLTLIGKVWEILVFLFILLGFLNSLVKFGLFFLIDQQFRTSFLRIFRKTEDSFEAAILNEDDVANENHSNGDGVVAFTNVNVS